MTPEPGGALAGVVLAGGRSSRLGADKAALRFSGRSLLARTYHLLAGLVPEVVVVGRDPAGQELPEAAWLLDETPGLGPIGGVLTALNRLERPCLVVSCDLPFMDGATLGRLLDARRSLPPGALLTTFLQAETGWIEALVAIYEPGCAPLLRRALDTGGRKLSAAVAPEFRHTVSYPREAALPFFNINYPADLALARRLCGEDPAAWTG